jgi:hypothetical protein
MHAWVEIGNSIFDPTPVDIPHVKIFYIPRAHINKKKLDKPLTYFPSMSGDKI